MIHCDMKVFRYKIFVSVLLIPSISKLKFNLMVNLLVLLQHRNGSRFCFWG